MTGDIIPLNPWQQRRLRAIEEAEARAAEISAFNAYWRAKADEVRAAEKAQRDREARGRQEIVRHLLEPGSMENLVFARATMDVPVDVDRRKAPKKFCWMPRGDHEISAGTMHGSTWTGMVRCDELAAKAVQASFADIIRAGLNCYIDFAHRDGEAAAWVRGFSWDAALGIMVAVDWTPAGEQAICDRVFLSFSPTFWVERDSGRVSGLVHGHAAGALVNNPAFGAAMPPILACAARDATAELLKEVLTTAGRSPLTVFAVEVGIKHGWPGEEIADLLRTMP